MERKKEYTVHIFLNRMEFAYYTNIYSFRVSGERDLWLEDKEGYDIGCIPSNVYKNKMSVSFKAKSGKSVSYIINYTI